MTTGGGGSSARGSPAQEPNDQASSSRANPTQAPMQMQTGSGDDSATRESSSGQPYVAIPRLRQPPPTATERPRVGHACEACRQYKARCSGGRPQCSRCGELKVECVYAAGKRGQHQQEFEKLRKRNALMQGILADLRSRTAPEDQQMIQDCLNSMIDEHPSGGSKRKLSGTPDETDTTAEVGSPESIDFFEDDVESTSIARAVGYLGKSSDVQWLRRAQQRHHGSEEAQDAVDGYGPPRAANELPSGQRYLRQKGFDASLDPLSGSTYHLDEQEMLTAQSIDSRGMPRPDVGRRLFGFYMMNVNNEFQFIEDSWTADGMMNSIWAAEHRGDVQTESRYRALLSIIFAIGASFAHLVGDAQGNERDHFLYYTRARMLGLDGPAFVNHPSLELVQIAALTGFYYLCSSQISRSWMITGYAVRAAYACGLHIRNGDQQQSDAQREKRVRLWWALWCLERQLAALSGRPTIIHDSDCSVPRPSLGTLPEPQAIEGQGIVSDQYSNLRIDILKISQDALALLYSPAVSAKSWASIQVKIEKIESDLQRWHERVPAELDFRTPLGGSSGYIRSRRTLGFRYHMCRILVTRHCLCPIDQRMEGQTRRSSDFNQRKAAQCVAAAGDIIDLLPNELDPVALYRDGPWYDQVNIIMRACAVIMLELSMGASHTQGVSKKLEQQTMKLGASLREMAKHNLAALSAWKKCRDLLVSMAPRIGMNISDLVTSDPPNNPVAPFNRAHSTYPGKPSDPIGEGMGASLADLRPEQVASIPTDAQSSFQLPFHSELQPSASSNNPDPTLQAMSWLDDIFFNMDPFHMDVFGSSTTGGWDPLTQTSLDLQAPHLQQPSARISGDVPDNIMDYSWEEEGQSG